MSTLQQEVIASAVPDLSGLPLDAEAVIDAAEYAAIMRGIGDGGDDRVTPVCAFNSNI